MFITTANTMRIPPALLDRMEVIQIGGYTEDEKLEIARRHLIPKQIDRHGLKKGEWSISDDALRDAIRLYTREAGVRNLEREIAKLSRKAVKEILLKAEKGAERKPAAKPLRVTRRNLARYCRRAALPSRRFRDRRPGGRRDRPRLHRFRRRAAIHRVGGHARQGATDDHRPSRRGHEGIGAGGGELCALAAPPNSASSRHRSTSATSTSTVPRRRDAEGRPLRRHRHDLFDRLGAHRHSHRPLLGGDDGRSDAARAGAAGGRAEGETPRGAARQREDGAHPPGQREGPRRDFRTT